MNQPLPKWEMWANMPALNPVEAVALSLNVDPLKVKEWPKDKWVFNTSRGLAQTISDFADRMLLFRRCFGFAGKISPPQLASWAKSVGWTIPAELETAKTGLQLMFVTSVDTDESLLIDTFADPDEEGIKRREQQIREIEKAGKFLEYDIRKIPTGGKKKLMELCQYARPDLFGVDVHSFDGAWKEARKQERVRMADQSKFAAE